MFAHQAAKMENQAKFNALVKLAKSVNLNLAFEPTKYVRGWPQASSRPYHLKYADGSHVASFEALVKLEKNLRGRAAC